VGGVCRHVDRHPGLGDVSGPAEGDLQLAVEDGEHLLEVVAMRRRPATRRDVHVDEGVAAAVSWPDTLMV
jgi:hypothetical protein